MPRVRVTSAGGFQSRAESGRAQGIGMGLLQWDRVWDGQLRAPSAHIPSSTKCHPIPVTANNQTSCMEKRIILILKRHL